MPRIAIGHPSSPMSRRDLGLVALRVRSPLARMAIPTERLELAEEEAIPVAVMRLDMIGDRGGDDMAMLAADPAHGLEAGVDASLACAR
jgi:hypothetical protein